MQLPLTIAFNEASSFENFVFADGDFLKASLQQLACENKPATLFVWGAAACGKTHLLHAVCRLAGHRHGTVSYLPLGELATESPALLQGLEDVDLICFDDLQSLRARSGWQHAVFDLFNRVSERGGRMLFAADASPQALGLSLPDLVSRLQSGPVFHVQALDDEQKIEVLRLRAGQRGLQLDREPARYLLSRFPRDLNALFAVLDTLDRQSLAKQRRLTIPFIREVFAEH